MRISLLPLQFTIRLKTDLKPTTLFISVIFNLSESRHIFQTTTRNSSMYTQYAHPLDQVASRPTKIPRKSRRSKPNEFCMDSRLLRGCWTIVRENDSWTVISSRLNDSIARWTVVLYALRFQVWIFYWDRTWYVETKGMERKYLTVHEICTRKRPTS